MINYVPMTSQHIADLVRIEEQCFNSGFAKATFQKELENKIAFYIVAEHDGVAVGYAGLWNMCQSADIMNVGVSPDFRRQGIAERMIAELEKFCRNSGIFEINLEVRVSNTPARQLYEKMGFCEIGIRKGYYDGKEDGVFMKKVIAEE